MARTFEVRPDAARELDEAAAFYQARRPNLGKDFVAEVLATIDLALVAPTAGSPASSVAEGARRMLLRRFPYAMVYLAEGDLIIVLAFVHHATNRR